MWHMTTLPFPAEAVRSQPQTQSRLQILLAQIAHRSREPLIATPSGELLTLGEAFERQRSASVAQIKDHFLPTGAIVASNQDPHYGDHTWWRDAGILLDTAQQWSDAQEPE